VCLEHAGDTRQVARFALRPEPESPKDARDFTTVTLSRWGMAELCHDAKVVVSELVTNALRHAWPRRRDGSASCPPIEVILFGHAGQLVCAVTDPCQQSPVPQEPDYAAETGRGLHVVASLSDGWGWLPLGGGRKAVWAALYRPAPDQDPGPATAAPGGATVAPGGATVARGGLQRDERGHAMASCEDGSN
jgi:anti-sigma regulatory factor (Ser/Thr protein kinase)